MPVVELKAAKERSTKSDRDPFTVKTFKLFRKRDVSGFTGTGIVAVGVRFPSGKCYVEFLGYPYTVRRYFNIETVIKVHGHQGSTVLIMDESK